MGCTEKTCCAVNGMHKAFYFFSLLKQNTHDKPNYKPKTMSQYWQDRLCPPSPSCACSNRGHVCARRHWRPQTRGTDIGATTTRARGAFEAEGQQGYGGCRMNDHHDNPGQHRWLARNTHLLFEYTSGTGTFSSARVLLWSLKHKCHFRNAVAASHSECWEWLASRLSRMHKRLPPSYTS